MQVLNLSRIPLFSLSGESSAAQLTVQHFETCAPGVGPALVVDGASRFVLGVGKMYYLATEGKKAAAELPTNFGGIVGATLYGTGSLRQKQLQLKNDLVTMLLTDGAFGMANDFNNFANAMEIPNYGLAAKNLGIFSANIYSANFAIKDLNETLSHK